jgi:hypothetical protein
MGPFKRRTGLRHKLHEGGAEVTRAGDIRRDNARGEEAGLICEGRSDSKRSRADARLTQGDRGNLLWHGRLPRGQEVPRAS